MWSRFRLDSRSSAASRQVIPLINFVVKGSWRSRNSAHEARRNPSLRNAIACDQNGAPRRHAIAQKRRCRAENEGSPSRLTKKFFGENVSLDRGRQKGIRTDERRTRWISSQKTPGPPTWRPNAY